MGDATSHGSWNPGNEGVRVTVVRASDHAVVTTPFDLTNKTPSAGIYHFGKVSKIQYNNGTGLSPVQGGYSYLADTLKYARIRAERQIKAGELPGGWFDPKDWDGWQKHMEGLIHRLDGVLALEGSTLELAHPPAPTVPELTM